MKKNKVAQILKEEMENARNTRTAAIKHAQLKREGSSAHPGRSKRLPY